EDVSKHLRSTLDQHRCPICNSPATQHERIATPAEFSRARLRRLRAKVEQRRSAVSVALEEIERAMMEHRQLVEGREEDRQNWDALRTKLTNLGSIEVPSDEELQSLRTAIDEGQKTLDGLLAVRTAAEAKYGRIHRKHKTLIDKTAKAIRARFGQY